MSSVSITDPLSEPIPSWRTYLELTKPRIIELLLTTTVPAMFVASGGWPDLWLVIATLVGGSLSAGGANAINNAVDHDIDQLMHRTARRPLPTDRVSARSALTFGIVLGAIGFGWLWLTTNLLAASLSTAGLLFYVFIYTLWLKRKTTQNIVIGGAAGSVPALVGWAAVTGDLATPAWIMFAIIFFWTPPHFWALALRYRDDYERAGVPMLPVVVGERPTLDAIAAYSVVVTGVSLLLFVAAPVGWVYLVAAGALGAWLIISGFRLRQTPTRAMAFFSYSNVYLAGIFVAMAVGAVVG